MVRIQAVLLTLVIASCQGDESFIPVYEGDYSGTVMVHTSQTVSGVTTTTDSTYQETITLIRTEDDQLQLISSTFGDRLFDLVPDSVFTVSYGFDYGMSFCVSMSGATVELYDYTFSGGGGFSWQMERSLKAVRE